MKSPYHIRSTIFLFIAFIFLYGCSKEEKVDETKYLWGSGCAKSTPDGRSEDCETPSKIQEELKQRLISLRKLDEEYPGPKGPNIYNLYNEKLIGVKDVTNSGVIRLDSGEELVLAGLQCSHPDLIKYLKNTFISTENAKVFYRISGLKEGTKQYAYIWEVVLPKNEPGSLDGASVSATNENAIASGWCDPVSQKKHAYDARYRAIKNLY